MPDRSDPWTPPADDGTASDAPAAASGLPAAAPVAVAAPAPADVLGDPADRWPSHVPWRAVVTFVVVACGLAWLVSLPLWLGDGLASVWFTPVAVVVMWTPAAAVLVATAIHRVPGRPWLRALGAWPLRPANRSVAFLAIAVVGPPLVVVAGALLSGAFGLVDLDLAEFSGFAAQLADAVPEGTELPPVQVLVLAQIASIPLGAAINSLAALGEEVGWRGWLLPALLPLGTWPALLVSGVVWGLWHAPLILLGYNFGRTDVTGVLLMVGGCVTWGVVLGWTRLRSGSLWPAVVGHGALNAAAGMVLILAAAGQEPDMAVVGPLGVVTWGVLAVVVLLLALTGQLTRRPGPARPGSRA